ncbi:SUMF1/EgtB/PvdO family nonheme iron enzyme [Dapis sp. BLCC M126]|uniref:formylglycine-generating enzyme family protein n=1 Tax=Dapis sp. BLCC M126 TaxID=3400189 RepID=UPI003CEAB6F1
MKNPPLINLFWRLREAGMKLGISQYELATQALLESIEMGLDISDKQAIARLYRTIWAKSREEQKLFDNCLNELLSQQKNLFSEFHQFIETATNNSISKSEVTAAEEEIVERSSTSNSEIPPESTFEPENFSESLPQQIPESETFPESLPQQIPESKTFPEILLPPTFNNPQVATAIPKTPKNGDYFPVSLAQIQQAKRLLFQPQLTDFSHNMNLQATVQQVAKQGFFVQPIYKYDQGKHRKIILLIDQSESMMPFNPFCRQIINYWQDVDLYYFDNVPKIRVYADSNFSEKKSLKTLLAGLVKEEILVLILSDGGAARGRFVSERVDKTENFIKFLSRKVERVAWLNPLPREKWRGTSAQEISAIGDENFNLKPFGLSSQEFKAMCQWLISGKLGRNLPVVKTDVEEVEIINENLDQIAAFTEYFGEPHLIFAQHAAFPLALTPDLLYRLWQRFFARERNFNIPWYAVADILLSSFCHPVDRELYEMDRGIRNQLLQLCTERFGESRLEELSRFLVSYIDSQVNRGEFVSSIWQGQRWTALAYTRPELAARQLAESLQEAYGRDDKAELVRLSSLMETLAEPLREYEPLLVMLGQGYGGYARGDLAGVENVRRELGRSQVDVEGVLLRVPVALPLQTFSFEVLTVNRRGEEINRVWKEAKFFTEDLGDGVIVEMVSIPGGTFLMGSPEDETGRFDTEGPQHQVSLEPFYMSKYPITQEQYQAIMSKNPSHFKGGNRPVEKVTWYNATEFCQQLSQKTRKNYRLPSESQWEYACRAGTTTPFYFGKAITTNLVNYHGNKRYPNAPKGIYRKNTTDVGSFPPNGFGLYDMHGNVWEWCADEWHENYENAPTDGKPWLNGDDSRSPRRGGSWLDIPYNCRSAYRTFLNWRNMDDDFISFRIVCDDGRTFSNQDKSTPNIQPKQQQIILPSTKPEAIITPQPKLSLKTFSFEVITVNRRGEEINRVPKQAQYFTEDLGNGVILEMVAIPSGTFTMGAPESEEGSNNRERPQHNVNISEFVMGRYPITQAQWKAIASRIDLKVNLDLKPDPSRFKKPYQGIDRWQRPVEQVNWYEAVEFCERLSKLTRKNYRLPSEAEWEYACRAGTTTPFHFGATITTDLANYRGTDNKGSYGEKLKGEYRGQSTPVGYFDVVNSFGLSDMHGNIWEWCTDEWHGNYDNAPTDGKAWLNGDDSRSPLRGGSLLYVAYHCRSAYRFKYDNWRNLISIGVGFRVVSDFTKSISNQSDSAPNIQQTQKAIILPSSKPEPPVTPQPKLPLKTFSFEVITVNKRGEEINRIPKQAEYFTEDLGNSVILEMVAIPGGTFTMGAPESEEGSNSRERPQHNVNISKFLIGRYPVTQAQWKAIVSRTELKVRRNLKPDPSKFKEAYQEQRPVERVNWYEAVEFCERLSKLTGRSYRLPSEAEWEYACRAGTTTPFCFGETITRELANYSSWGGQTTFVGKYPPNAFGLYDMHGNVWEWCADDWHDNYENAPTDGSAWLYRNENSNKFLGIIPVRGNIFNQNNEKKLYAMLRGGCWHDYPNNCRSAVRDSYRYSMRDGYTSAIGFRVVCISVEPLTLQDKSTPNIQPKQQPIILPSTQPESIITPQPKLPLKTFSFEVITVNRRGEEINRVPKQAQYFTENLGNGVILEMVAIPGGTFLMGSPENEERKFKTESPQHQVNLQPFYMSKYPITQEQYLAVMSKNPSNFKGRNLPVETVTWYNATEFCQKLSQKTTKIYQLPSESQWEYACRAGTTTPFYFGETITTDLVNYDGNSTYADAPKGKYRQKTTDVGSFPPNAFGLYDMHGNVWEWCQDIWHESYEGGPNDGSAWEDRDTDISPVRGGSWHDSPDFCRSAVRVSYFGRVFRYDYFGFRIVCNSVIPNKQDGDRQHNQDKV